MNVETHLLDNMLQALDRLYDRKTSAIDVQALAEATAAALPDHDVAPTLSQAAQGLQRVVCAEMPPDEENTAALVATDALRQRLANVL